MRCPVCNERMQVVSGDAGLDSFLCQCGHTEPAYTNTAVHTRTRKVWPARVRKGHRPQRPTGRK